jgi:molybdate transport system substrate-binding protein
MANVSRVGAAKLVLAAALLFGPSAAVAADDIKVLSVPALKTSVDVLGPQFERETGHRLLMNYAGSSDLIRRFDAGEVFDAALVWPAMIERLLKEGKIAVGTPTKIARVAIAVAVMKGAPKPDISTTETFKKALLDAKSVSLSTEGSSGVYFKGLLDRLGIAAQMQSKLRPVPGGPFVVGPVARGEVELAVITTPYIVIEPGAELVGPLPDELQQYVDYTAALASGTRQREGGKALIGFLTSPSSAAVMKSQGLDPVAP